MFGVDVYYIPRKMIDTDDVLGEVQSSKFNDAYIIEAYLNNFEGYAKGSDIMTKFGINLQNEITLTISRERYEDFIAPFIVTHNAKNAGTDVLLGERPKEGDLIFFPLGERLFEIKHVEHENPFYQLGKIISMNYSANSSATKTSSSIRMYPSLMKEHLKKEKSQLFLQVLVLQHLLL